jgi:hypothetical protein
MKINLSNTEIGTISTMSDWGMKIVLYTPELSAEEMLQLLQAKKQWIQALKLVKRNKIRPEHLYNNSLVIRWWELKFVYGKSNWEHILITCWKRCKI